MAEDRTALGAFLRSRRDRLTPAQAGIEAFPGPRRVPGMRKEELAVLAGVSPDYYSRLEQGRQPHVSRAVLDALARALRLDNTEHAHLLDLADPPRRQILSYPPPQRPDPGMLRLMTTLEHVPALLLGQRSEVLARNRLLTVVLSELPLASAFVRYLFLDPMARARIVNWSDFASTAVAALRRETGRRPFDARLKALVAELRSANEDVDTWWDDHSVRDYASVRKEINHPLVGRMTFDIESVSPPYDPDQRLVIYTVEPGSPTAQLLPILASWLPSPASPTSALRPRSEGIVGHTHLGVGADCVNGRPI